MRPGDVIVKLADNQISHVAVYCGHSGIGANLNGQYVTAYGTYDANAGTNPSHSTDNSGFSPNDGVVRNPASSPYQDYVIYTRYPD